MVCEGLAERLKKDYRKNALDNPNRNIFSNLIPPLLYPNHPANLTALQARYRREHPSHEPACHRRARNEGRREGFAYGRDRMDHRHRAERKPDERNSHGYSDSVARGSRGHPDTEDAFDRYLHHREKHADYRRMVEEAHERRRREHEFQRRHLSPGGEERSSHRYRPDDYPAQEPGMQHRRQPFGEIEERMPPRRQYYYGFDVEDKEPYRYRQFGQEYEGMRRCREAYNRGVYDQPPAYGDYEAVPAYDDFDGEDFRPASSRGYASRRYGEEYEGGLDSRSDRGFSDRNVLGRRTPRPYSYRW